MTKEEFIKIIGPVNLLEKTDREFLLKVLTGNFNNWLKEQELVIEKHLEIALAPKLSQEQLNILVNAEINRKKSDISRLLSIASRQTNIYEEKFLFLETQLNLKDKQLKAVQELVLSTCEGDLSKCDLILQDILKTTNFK